MIIDEVTVDGKGCGGCDDAKPTNANARRATGTCATTAKTDPARPKTPETITAPTSATTLDVHCSTSLPVS